MAASKPETPASPRSGHRSDCTLVGCRRCLQIARRRILARAGRLVEINANPQRETR